jgi:hypothetical protein
LARSTIRPHTGSSVSSRDRQKGPETSRLPAPCPDEAYEAAMAGALDTARGATAVAFGDLFLEDVRR